MLIGLVSEANAKLLVHSGVRKDARCGRIAAENGRDKDKKPLLSHSTTTHNRLNRFSARRMLAYCM